MKKIKKFSISRIGLKYDYIDSDHETIAIVIPNKYEDAIKYKKVYVDMLKKEGIIIKHQKDICHIKPFWRFRGIPDCNIAVFKVIIQEINIPIFELNNFLNKHKL